MYFLNFFRVCKHHRCSGRVWSGSVLDRFSGIPVWSAPVPCSASLFQCCNWSAPKLPLCVSLDHARQLLPSLFVVRSAAVLSNHHGPRQGRCHLVGLRGKTGTAVLLTFTTKLLHRIPGATVASLVKAHGSLQIQISIYKPS